MNDGHTQGLLDRIWSKRGAMEGRLFVLLAKFWPFCPVNIVSAHTAKCVKTQRLVLTLRKQANVFCVGTMETSHSLETTVDIAEVVQYCKRASKRQRHFASSPTFSYGGFIFKEALKVCVCLFTISWRRRQRRSGV